MGESRPPPQEGKGLKRAEGPGAVAWPETSIVSEIDIEEAPFHLILLISRMRASKTNISRGHPRNYPLTYHRRIIIFPRVIPP